MGYPKVCDQVRPSGQRSTRTGSIVRHIWHHQAGTNDDATINMMVSGSKEVSANTTVSGGDYKGRGIARITGVVDMDYCAWTSSSRTADGRAHTTEVANSSGAPTYGISEETYAACALLAAYDYLELGIPLKRATKADPTGHMGHNEVLGFFGQGYATACPLNLNIDRIIRDGASVVAGTSAIEKTVKENTMQLIIEVAGDIEKKKLTGRVAEVGEFSFTEFDGANADGYDPHREFDVFHADYSGDPFGYDPSGRKWRYVNTATYELARNRATARRAAFVKDLAAGVPARAGGSVSVDLEPVIEAISKIPAATRAAIVK